MLRHKALIQAARYAFGFSGIVDPDEWERSPESLGPRDITPAPRPTRADFSHVDPAAAGHVDPDAGYRQAMGEVVDAEPEEVEAEETSETPQERSTKGDDTTVSVGSPPVVAGDQDSPGPGAPAVPLPIPVLPVGAQGKEIAAWLTQCREAVATWGPEEVAKFRTAHERTMAKLEDHQQLGEAARSLARALDDREAAA
jgi:hypothetical protein